MFSGIVEEVGRVERLDTSPDLTRLTIRASDRYADAGIGASIAINGTCLTVVECGGGAFAVEATPETLRCTNLGQLSLGDGVHLERALSASGEIGGHFVQGHIDAVGTILDLQPEGDSIIATYGAPPEVMRYVVPKGSIAIDGVSLTVVEVAKDRFTVALIPHTIEVTLLTKRPIGSAVNLEADVLAKYVARAVELQRSDG